MPRLNINKMADDAIKIARGVPIPSRSLMPKSLSAPKPISLPTKGKLGVSATRNKGQRGSLMSGKIVGKKALQSTASPMKFAEQAAQARDKRFLKDREKRLKGFKYGEGVGP